MSANSSALAIVSPYVGIDINRVLTQRDAIQKLLKEVLKEGIDNDYAVIPGTKKKTLLKPGAEKICSLFGFAVEPSIEAIRDGGDVTFRVIVRLTSGGVFLGEGVGEASTLESKFAWRQAVCSEEWDDADPQRRRKHWKKGYNNGPPEMVYQVREDPNDKMNNTLKISKKRALIDAVLTATAASDIFTQDLEGLIDKNGGKSTAPVSGRQVEAAMEEIITSDESKKFFGMWKNKGKHTKETVTEYLKLHCGGITDDRKMPKRCYAAAMAWAATEGAPIPPVKKPEPAPAAASAAVKPAEEAKPEDHVMNNIKAAFDILGYDFAQQAAMFGEYRDRFPELEAELKSRVESEASGE